VNTLVIGIFVTSALLWAAIRMATWPLPEWSRRAFWVVVIVMISLPTFLGRRMNSDGATWLLSLMGGLAASEFIFVGGYQRWLAFQVRREARAKEARRTARRLARREAREKKDQPEA
jgi:hypothetical protein